MSKAADKEIEAMAHLATEVDKVRPIDRERVGRLVAEGIRMERHLGAEVSDRVCDWLIMRAAADTDAANHEAELRRAAKAKAAEPGEPAADHPNGGTPAAALGPMGFEVFECDEPGHSRCEQAEHGEPVHHLVAAGA